MRKTFTTNHIQFYVFGNKVPQSGIHHMPGALALLPFTVGFGKKAAIFRLWLAVVRWWQSIAEPFLHHSILRLYYNPASIEHSIYFFIKSLTCGKRSGTWWL